MGTSPYPCCGGDCPISSDDFNRANSNHPGCNWIELGSDWKIADHQLQCVTAGPLITRAIQPPSMRPTSSQSAMYPVQIFFTLTGVDDGVTEWGVICGFEDENKFDWIRFERESGTPNIWPSFVRRVNGNDTVLLEKSDFDPDTNVVPFSLNSEDEFEGCICYGRQDWTVDEREFGSENSWSLCGGGKDNLPEDPRCGLVGFLKGNFDNWSYDIHWEGLLDCDYCSCFCRNPNDVDDFACFPKTLKLKFIPHAGNAFSCPAMDYREITLKQGYYSAPDEQVLESPSKVRWESVPEGFPPYPDGEPFPVEFVCPGTLTIYFTAGGWVTPPGEEYSDDQGPDWSRSTCHPLRLVYPDVEAGEHTCDRPPDPEGIQPALCPSLCMDDTQDNTTKIANMRWTPILTET